MGFLCHSSVSARAASGTWTNLGGGSWAAATNWSGGVIASGSGNTADFSTLTLTTGPTVTLDGAQTIGNLRFGDIGNAFGWTLNTGSGGTLTLAGTTPTITVNGQTTAVNLVLAGNLSLTKAGMGALTLGGTNTYSGGTIVSAGTLNIGTMILAGDTTSSSTRTNTISIAAGALVQSSGTLSLNASSSLNPAIDLSGAGTLLLTSTTGSATSPDLIFGANDTANSTANWGTRIACALNLGNAQRFIWGRTDHNGVGEYGVNEADCQFGGSITGSGGLTLIAQDSYTGSNPMETPFCLNGTNTFTGTLEIRRGSVYLGNAFALTQSNVLFFNSSGTNNARLFLLGNSVTVSNLSSATPGSMTNNMIANANITPNPYGPATLTIIQNENGTFTGRIVDWFTEYGAPTGALLPTLSLVKNGPGILVLPGTNAYTGTTTIGQGSLILSNSVNQTLSGAIQGPGALALSGSASNTLSGLNTFSGGLTLNAGSLGITTGNGLGAGLYTVAETAGGNFLTVATSSAATITNNISLPNGSGNYILTKNASGQLNLNGVISGGGPNMILRTTTDTSGDKTTVLALNNTNTFAGGVQLFRGVVLVGNPNALGAATVYGDGNASSNGDLCFATSMTLTNPLVLQSATSISPGANNVTMTGGISGGFALSTYGAGSLTLAGPCSFSGALGVNAGTLYMNTADAGGGAVTVANGATLAGNGSVAGMVTVANGGALAAGDGTGSGTLTLNALTLGTAAGNTATLDVTLNRTPGVFSVTSNNGLILNGGSNSVTINVAASSLAAGQYHLITYQGSLGGAGFAAFQLGTLPMLPQYGSAQLSNNTANSSIDLLVQAASPANLDQWSGALSSQWSTNVLALPKNWLLASDGVTPRDFAPSDIVYFTDAASNFNVNISVADVTPASVTFSNMFNPYIVTGSNAITGPATVSMTGHAGVTILNNNTYTGQTIISGRSVQVGNGGATGSLGSGNISNDTLLTYDLGGTATVGSVMTGTGALQQMGGGTLILKGNNSYSGGTMISSGTLQVDNGGVAATLGTGPVTNNSALTFDRTDSPVVTNVISGTGSVTNSAGTLTLAATNSYSAGTTLAGGSLVISNASGLGSGPFVVTETSTSAVNILTVATSNAVSLSNNIVLPSGTGTNVLTKFSGGSLALAGAIIGGPNEILRTTASTTGDVNTIFLLAGANAMAGGLQISGGVLSVANPSAIGTGTVYLDANNSTNGDLNFTAPMTFNNPIVLQAASSISPSSNNVTLAGTISGNLALTKDGSGTLTLQGLDNRSGANTAVAAGTLRYLNTVNTYADQTIAISASAFAQSTAMLNLNVDQNGSVGSFNVTGAGTLQLTSTTDSSSNADVYFGPDHVNNDYWGVAIGTTLDLGSAQRFFFGKSGHNGVGEYGLSKADCLLNGPIIGSGGLTIIAQMTYNYSTPLMEVPFCLNASNSFTGPVELQRGSIYLGHAGALSQTNVLFLNASGTNNARFFLYGQNAAVANLSSSVGGTNEIANGNEKTGASLTLPAVTLTVWQNTNGIFWGSILDVQPEYDGSGSGTTGSLNLAKNGPATLSLNGSNAFTGTVAVNAGALYINAVSTGGGAVTVANGATLGGTGMIYAPVSVTNGGTVEAGSGAGLGIGALSVNSIALGASASDAITLNCDANPAGIASLSVLNANGFTNNATVTVNINGLLPAAFPVVYTVVSYSGTIHGGGSFVLGSVPDQAVAYLTNNAAASAIQLVVSSVTIPSVTWNGAPSNHWDLLGGDDWKRTGTSTSAAFVNGDETVFDDTAANFSVNLAATVAPNGVLVSNSLNNYNLSGAGSISGYTGLTKQGSALLTLGGSNTYSGPTTISAGTVSLATASAIPSGTSAGNVTLNGTLDVAGFNLAVNNLSGAGTVDNLSAGGSPVLTAATTGTTTFAGAIQNSSGTLSLVKSGPGTLSLSGANSFSGGTTISGGILQVGAGGASGTLGLGGVNNNATLAFNRSDDFIFPNNVFGSGNLLQNGSGATTVTGNLTYSGQTVVNSGTLVFPNDVTFDAGAGAALTILTNAVMQSGFVLSLNANSTSTAIDISGAGTVQLASTIDRIESFPDLFIGANNDGVSTANYGVRLAAALNLGAVQRLVWAIGSRNDVARYGVTGCDCQFAGPISGTAQLSLLGKNSWAGVNTMEEPFAFNASNSFTGPLEVLRGSVYLGNANALTMSNVLIMDPAASVNSRLFLYGFNASISDLQTGGYGSVVIANGNNLTSSNVGPATLTLTENNPTTFAGDIVDWYTEYTAPPTGPLSPTLSLVKSGAAALTLTGSNSYSGTTVINSGQLYFNGISTGGGAVTVNSGGVLGGNGTFASAVTVKNGGAIESGGGSANGNLTLKTLTLGTSGADASVLNLASSAVLELTGNNGLLINSGPNSVTLNVRGTINSLGATPLITYVGALGGTGFAGFQLGATPAGVLGYLSNDTANASIDFVATLVTIPRWSGAVGAVWSTNVLSLPKNWVLDSDGVTAVDYMDGESVKFEDTAASSIVNISVANVSPLSVLFSNSLLNYSVSGAYGITGTASVIKQGAGTLLLGTSNSYSGATTIATGTLAMGAAGAIPGGPGMGNVTVNGILDVAGFSPLLNNLSGSGIVDNVSAGGSPMLTVNSTVSSTFAGVIQNTSGTLGLSVTGAGGLTLSGSNTYTGPTVISNSTLTLNGSLAAGGLIVQNGSALGGLGKMAGTAAMQDGSALNLTANAPLTVGPLALNGLVTVNVAGFVSSSNSAIYVLLHHAARSGTGSFLLAPVPGIINSGFTATLKDTNNQLQLVVGPTQPTGTIADVRHVVIFMQENRSFDHYFGTLHGVHGYSDHVKLTFRNGNSDLYQPNGSSYELPFHTSTPCLSDLAHDWASTHAAWDSGNWDMWVAEKGTETMAYYNRADVPYYYALADAFTICDEYHCSTMTSTDPNRLHLWTGMLDPNDTGGGPVIDNTEPANGWGTNWVTYPQFLQKAGVSWKVYQASDNYDDNALYWFAAYKNAAPGTPLYVNGVSFVPSVDSGTTFPADYTNLVTAFKADVSNNVLPSVSWIVGPDVGSEHPSWSPGDGEILTKGLLDALASNPQVYNSTVFILNYDENDGFFDHAVPITPTNGTPSEFVSGLPIGLGVRVPCIIVSPWSRGGYVCSQVFDHTSVIRFLEKWTGVQCPNISPWRRQVCGDLTSALDFAHPNTNYPVLAAATENDCPSGTTVSPPAQQTLPVQEAGTLLERPLPYQPNAAALTDCGDGLVTINLTNSGSASVHYSIYPNAYRTDGPWPYDVNPTNSASVSFNAAADNGDYDFSCYGPNGFLRRFAGYLNADCGQIEVTPYLNPYTGGFEITLANPSASNVVFTVTNGYFSNTLATYPVPAGSTNLVVLDTTTNNGWYDLIATAGSDPLFLRRFAGHIETNAAPVPLASSEAVGGYNDLLTFTATLVGYGVPTGTVQFLINGVALGAAVTLSNGVAVAATSLLPRGTNLVTAVYSGDALNAPVTNIFIQVVTNHAPVTTPVSYVRLPGLPLQIGISNLLSHDTDPDGDSLTLAAVDATSALGTPLTTHAQYVIYSNTTNAAPDSFGYSIMDGFGGSASGLVNVTVAGTNVETITRVLPGGANAVVSFTVVPNYSYVVQRALNLTPPISWFNIVTNAAASNGLFQATDNFVDLTNVPPAAYYRLMIQQ